MTTTAVKTAAGAIVSFNTPQDANGNLNWLRSSEVITAPSLTPTVTSGSAYASGNVVGALLTFANAVRGVDLLAGVIDSVIITDKSANQIPYDVWFFDSDPSSGSTITDKTNLAIGSAALLKSLGFVAVSAWCTATTGGAVAQASFARRFKIASGTSLYAVLIARGTPTYSSTSDITVRVVIAQG